MAERTEYLIAICERDDNKVTLPEMGHAVAAVDNECQLTR